MAILDIQASVLSITNQTPTANSVEDAQRFVVSSIPKELLTYAQTVSSTFTGGAGVAVTANESIADVQRNGYSCRQISLSESKWAGDSSSLKYATSKHPVYWMDSGVIKILPEPAGVEDGYYYFIDYSKIDDSSDLRNAVINYSVSKEFTKLASDNLPSWGSLVISSSPPSPSFGSDLIISASAPVAPESPSFTYTNASVSDIVKPLISIGDMAALEESAPSYDKPILNLTSFPTISWTLPDAPVSPIVNAESGGITIDFSQAAPTYTPPVMTSPDWADTENWITTEEDSEMLSSRIQAIQAQISEFSAKLNESQAFFNKESAEYQAQLQISIQNASQKSSGDGMVIQKFSNSINSYQAEVNSIISSNTNQIVEWQQENTLNIQRYGADIQNELNEFNKDNTVYQQDIQRKLQNLAKDIQENLENAKNGIAIESANLGKDVQLAVQNAAQDYKQDVEEYAAKLQTYNSELSVYDKNVQKEVQDYTNTLNKNVQEYQSKLALYSAELQKYQSETGEKMQEAALKSQNMQRYEREADRYYAWAKNEIQSYIQNNSKMIQQTMAAQMAAQQQG